jgi:hypothetical protein
MENNIQIPILSNPQYIIPTGSQHDFTAGLYGGGSDNIWYATWAAPGSYPIPEWPDYYGCWDTVVSDLCICSGGFSCGMTIGQTWGAGMITVEDSSGVDKTAECTGTFHAVVACDPAFGATACPPTWNADPAATGQVIGIFVNNSSGYGITGIVPGDVLKCPAGTNPSDSWNAYNPGDAFGTHANASGALNFVVQEDWVDVSYDTNPLLVNVDEIICVKPISTTQVGIVMDIPADKAGSVAEFTIDMNEAAPTAMSLVECINRAIREAGQRPSTAPMVDWKYTHSVTQFSETYSLTLAGTA